MKYFIVTGTSSGIGEALARKLILDGHGVFCISRRVNESLTDLALSLEIRMWYFETDLGNLLLIPQLIKDIFDKIARQNITGISLINNAGILEPMTFAGNYSPEALAQHLHVNLLAPMLITNEFIKHTRDFPIAKNVINISSGAANSPYEGWGPYCSSKAGLDMFTKTTALEQKHAEYPVRIISVAPGIVNTRMQTQIRQSPEENFTQRRKFEKLYRDNLLSNPAEVAEKIIRLTCSNTAESGQIVDLRNI